MYNVVSVKNNKENKVDRRLEQLENWLKEVGVTYQDIAPASADASFRRYFRITNAEDTFIVMDAPPEKEDSKPFIHIANMLFEFGLNVPQVLKHDLQQGFILLSDLGTTVFLSKLNNNSVDELYGAAMKSILDMQQHTDVDLPAYDETLLRNELALFPDWYLKVQLKVSLSQQQKNVLDNAFDLLAENALAQPQVCVHRDYHSRNLMINNKHPDKPGVIDFQDAVIGAVTYDLVSLIKDCYINWPREKIESWVNDFYTQALSLGIIKDVTFEKFLRWFDLMGLQRHLKVAGIFSRLKHRDGKTGYLKDIPRTMDYVFDVVARYPEFKPLANLLNDVT